MNTVNYFLSVIEWVFLQPREEKLFSARRNFCRLVWEKISTTFFDTAKVQQFFRMSKYFAKYFLIISQIFFLCSVIQYSVIQFLFWVEKKVIIIIIIYILYI